MTESEPKPTLHLLPGIPTVEQLAEMYRRLTGREPDPEDLKAAEATLARVQAKLGVAAPQSPPSWTPEEQEILDLVARAEGREWAEAHAYLILEQARARRIGGADMTDFVYPADMTQDFLSEAELDEMIEATRPPAAEAATKYSPDQPGSPRGISPSRSRLRPNRRFI